MSAQAGGCMVAIEVPYHTVAYHGGHRGAMGRPLIHRERGAGIGLQPAGLLAAIPELCLRDCNVFVAKTELVL